MVTDCGGRSRRCALVELPADSYFANLKNLFSRLEGIDTVLQDSHTTSVRLVTNAERMVLRETQRAFAYFLLHGLTVDAVIVNRLLPSDATGSYLGGLRKSQQQVLGAMDGYFAPVPVRQLPMFACCSTSTSRRRPTPGRTGRAPGLMSSRRSRRR